jgi:hypothetical protein
MSTEPKLNKKLVDLILKLKTSTLEQLNAGMQSIQEAQKNLYAHVHQWLAQQSPQTIQKYDASPAWIKSSLVWLPWALLVLLTLYYFDVF